MGISLHEKTNIRQHLKHTECEQKRQTYNRRIFQKIVNNPLY